MGWLRPLAAPTLQAAQAAAQKVLDRRAPSACPPASFRTSLPRCVAGRVCAALYASTCCVLSSRPLQGRYLTSFKSRASASCDVCATGGASLDADGHYLFLKSGDDKPATASRLSTPLCRSHTACQAFTCRRLAVHVPAPHGTQFSCQNPVQLQPSPKLGLTDSKIAAGPASASHRRRASATQPAGSGTQARAPNASPRRCHHFTRPFQAPTQKRQQRTRRHRPHSSTAAQRSTTAAAQRNSRSRPARACDAGCKLRRGSRDAAQCFAQAGFLARRVCAGAAGTCRRGERWRPCGPYWLDTPDATVRPLCRRISQKQVRFHLILSLRQPSVLVTLHDYIIGTLNAR